MSRKRFIVRLGRWDGIMDGLVAANGENSLSVSMVKSNECPRPIGRGGEENWLLVPPLEKDSSESERFRLRTMLKVCFGAV